ncbi:putative E3 ubiquitin-protein ligase CIP8-like [Cocos nucifera]|uniref:RING-type E3 ubiquitin transferase n=1 Tax=Cocos nucifera TaxID=13894 RepID=A0A8K0HWS3_COCNU|nr:putative E3 ubiquitin-protein ligase CIP8-like [Cocos nucifera]
MAEAVHDYVLSEGVPATGSCLEGSTYRRGHGIREEECAMEFDAGAEVSRMPCSHTFHNRCIIQWLEMSNVCPICGSQVPTASSN